MATMSAVAFRFRSFQDYPVRHGMSGREPSRPYQGDVGHSPSADAGSIEANRQGLLDGVGVCFSDLTVARQTHSSSVRVVTREDRGRGLSPRFDGFPATDGLLTADPSVAVGVLVADCVPLLLYDPRQHVLAVVHAGWRGTVGKIAFEAVQRMRTEFGTRPADIVAGIGPSIGPCCYEVGEDVVDAWQSASALWGGAAVRRTDSAYHFDLWTANCLILTDAGVLSGNVDMSSVCVKCDSDRFFSYRAARQDGAQRGSMMMVAQLRDEQRAE